MTEINSNFLTTFSTHMVSKTLQTKTNALHKLGPKIVYFLM